MATCEEENSKLSLDRNVEKKGILLNIDLNVAPPEDGGSESPAEESDGNAAVAATDESDEEPRKMEPMKIVADSEGEEESERRKRRWNALFEIAEEASREYEEGKVGNRKRVEHGGEAERGTARKKIAGGNSSEEWGEVAAAPVVVRSTRGRLLAMPNKYRDSVLDAAAVEAEFRRRGRSGKSAAVVSTRRKSR